VELAIAPGESRFRVVASIKGGTRIGATKFLPELAPPAHQHSLLKDLITIWPDEHPYQIAPPIRETDRLIVFLRAGNEPANWTMLTSTIWLQDAVGYTFKQTMNPGPTHLVPYFIEDFQIEKGKPIWKPKPNEAQIRAEINSRLQLRATFDHAVANHNLVQQVAELAGLVTSGDDVAIRGTLAQLNLEGPEAARALRPFLEDDRLLNVHFQILDTIALTGARDIHLDSIISHETNYWAQTCHATLDGNWARNYGEPSAFHYLRLISALKAIRALGISGDLPAVREFLKLMNGCRHLNQQQELVQTAATFVGK
jgi:hypothetical protein